MAVYSLPNIGRGVDFLAFYQAARAMLHGGDPYSARNFVSAPGLAALLEPLARLPFRAAYWVFTVVTGLLGAGTVVLVGRDLGWRHPELLAAGALVSWIGFSGLLQGQVDALLLAILLGSILLLTRGRTVAAGVVVGLFWLKPDVMWPLVAFAGVALWPERRALLHYLAGLLLTSLLFLGLGAAYLSTWMHALLGLGARAGGQTDLAGLPVLLSAAPPGWGLGTGFRSPVTWTLIVVILAGLSWLAYRIATSKQWLQLPRPRRILWAVGLPMALWLLVTPYAHPYDDLLVLPLLMLVVGKDAVATREWGPAIAILLMAGAPIVWLWIPIEVSWLGVAALLLAAAATLRREMAPGGIGMGEAVLVGEDSNPPLTRVQPRPGGGDRPSP